MDGRHFERKPLTWRTRLKRLVRKTICFSKSLAMHDIVIGLFINRYEFGLSAEIIKARSVTPPAKHPRMKLCNKTPSCPPYGDRAALQDCPPEGNSRLKHGQRIHWRSRTALQHQRRNHQQKRPARAFRASLAHFLEIAIIYQMDSHRHDRHKMDRRHHAFIATRKHIARSI